MKEMDRLIRIMETLRGPGGCPWDAKQDHKSMLKGLIEETYELADAVEKENNEDMLEELGDVLLHVVFHSIIAAEDKAFTMADVIDRLSDKLVYRHPHVFGDARVKDADEVTRNWDRLKRKENGKENRTSIFEGIPGTLPALLYALKIQSKAARVGFDWDGPDGVMEKIREETEEVAEAVGQGEDAVTEEIGDLFFTVVNLARMHGVDPEAALRRSNRKFVTRFREIEEAARRQGIGLSDMPMEEKERIWQAAKGKKGEG